MKTFLKVLLSLFLSLLILIVVGIVFLFVFDLNSYKPTLERQASEALGRPVQIGSMELDWSFIPQIELKDIVIQNPTGFSAEMPCLKTDSIRVNLALIPLFQKKIEVRSVEVGKAQLFFMQNDGKSNWQFSQEKGDKQAQKEKWTTNLKLTETYGIGSEKTVKTFQPSAGGDNVFLSNLRVDDISVDEVRLIYQSSDNQKQQVLLKDMTLKQLRALTASLVVQNKTIKISANLDSLLKLIQQKPDYAFNIDASFSGMTAKISGTISDISQLDGILLNVTLTTSNLRQSMEPLIGKQALLPAFPVELSAALQGTLDQMDIVHFSLLVSRTQMTVEGAATVTGLRSSPQVDFNGRLNLQDERLAAMYQTRPLTADFKGNYQAKKLRIDMLNILANRSDIAFNGDINLEKSVPAVQGKVVSEYLDVMDILSLGRGTSSTRNTVAQTSSSSLFPVESINFSALAKVNAQLDFELQNIQAPEALSSYLGGAGTLRLTDGDLDLRLNQGTAMSGRVEGKLTLNTTKKPTTLSLMMNAHDLHLNDIRMMRPYVQDSLIDLDVALETKGESLKNFADALSGTAIMEVTGGTIVNKWFNSLPATMGVIKSRTNALSFSSSDQESKILCGAMNLNIRDGVITSDKSIAIEANTINFVLGGSVNLKDETISLSMIPSINTASDETNQLASLLQVLKISGPFTKPQVKLDVNDIAKDLIQEGTNVLMKNLLEKQGSIGSSGNEPYAICRRVLGKKSRAQREQEQIVPITIPSAQPAPQPQVQSEPLTPQQEFKQQLLDGLSKALKQD